MNPAKDPLHFVFPHKRLNKSLRVLIASNTALTFVIGLFAPFYAIYIQKLGGGIAFAGLSWAIFGIVTGVLTIAFSYWGLKVKEPELLIALGYFIRGLSFFSYAFMGSMAQLVLTQVLWGIGAAIGTPAFDSVYAAHTEGEQSMLQWASWEGFSSIAAGLAAIGGGLLIESFGYQTVFLIMGIVMVLLSLYIWRLPREVL